MPQSFVLLGIHDLYLLAVSPVFVWLTIWLTYSSQVILPYLWSGHICAPLRQAHAILPGTGTSRILFLVLTNSKYVLAKSAKVLTSGPPTSGTRPAAPESASSARRSATSPTSIGWKRKPFGARRPDRDPVAVRTSIRTRGTAWPSGSSTVQETLRSSARPPASSGSRGSMDFGRRRLSI